MTDPQFGIPLEIELLTEPGAPAAAIGIKGELVVTNHERLEAVVDKELKAGSRGIVLNMEGLTHVDTPGLAALVRLQRHCVEAGARMAIASMPEAFRAMSTHLRLADVLSFFDSRQDAVASLDS